MPDTTEETETERTSRSQMFKHEDIVGFLTDEGLITPQSSQAEVIAAFAANRNRYRRTDRYRNLVETHRSAGAEAVEARKAERAAAKAAKAEERAAAKEAKATEAAAAKAAAAAKETAATPEAPAKATRKGKGKAAPVETTEDNPFE